MQVTNLYALFLGLLACTSGSSSSGPNGTQAASSSSKLLGA
jgi:hypothetical protein